MALEIRPSDRSAFANCRRAIAVENEGGPPEGGWRAAVRIRKPDKEDKGFAAPMHKGECFRPEGDGPVLGGSTSAGM